MSVSRAVGEHRRISPFFALFLIHCSIVGVGILKFQKEILEPAGYDQWMSVLLAGATVHALVWMMYYALNAGSGADSDAVQANEAHFGRWIGAALSAALVAYFLLAGFVIFRIFLEVLQVWLFPDINLYPLAVVLLILLYYIVSGGLRSVTGMSLWGMAIPYVLTVPLFFFALKYLHPTNLLPVGTHSVQDIFASARYMVFPYLGFETMLLLYPFFHRPAESQRWAQAGVGVASVLYLFVALVTLMYYSDGQLRHIIWPTLNIIMMIEVPVMQRLEYLVISAWLLRMIASVSISLWAACRGAGRLWPIQRRVSLPAFLALYLASLAWIGDRRSIDWLAHAYNETGFWLMYGYIPAIFLFAWAKKRIRGRRSC